MRKLKYHIATTADGFIAREDGSFDCFPTEGEHAADYLESLKTYGAVLMGRGTCEVGLGAGVTDPYRHLKSYVFSRTLAEGPDERVRVVSENAAEVVRGAEAGDGQGYLPLRRRGPGNGALRTGFDRRGDPEGQPAGAGLRYMREIGERIEDPQNPPEPEGLPSEEEMHRTMEIIGRYMEILPPDKIQERAE